MTDYLSPHPDDELLSAVLDGEATADQRDHVAACTACQARVDRLDGVRGAVRVPPPADGGAVDASVAAGLAAWDAASAHAASTHLARRRRRRAYVPPAAWVGIAAVVLALLAAAPLLFGTNGDDDAGVAAGGGETDEVARPGRREVGDRGLSPDEPTALAAPAGFGRHDDTSTLIAELEGTDAYADRAASSADDQAEAGAAAPAGDPCLAEAYQVAETDAELVTTGPVTWRGEGAVVVVFRVDADVEGRTRQLLVMARGDCAVRAEQHF
jgi:hypothetical protein